MRKTIVMVSLAVVLLVGVAPSRGVEPKQPALKRLMMADVQAWKNIRGVVLSNDGQWLAYRLVPNEGDGEVVLRQVQGEKELKFPAGEGRGFGLFPDIAFSHDSKWLAFGIHPSSRESRAAQPSGDGRPAASPRSTPRNKVGLINVGTGEKVEFENIRSFAFSGEAGSWLALHKYPPEGRTPLAPTQPADGRGPSPFGPSASLPPVGADLLLHELATGSELNLGNVSEFVFDKKGQWLALVIDAQGQSGNGVQLRNMTTGALLPLDSAKATYRRLNWTEKGDAFAVLRGTAAKLSTPPAAASGSSAGTADQGGDNRQYVVVGFTDLSDRTPHKVVYDPKSDTNFPKDMAISANRSPTWTEDLGGLLFGIYQPKQKSETAAPKPPDKLKPKPGADAKTAGKAPEPPRDKPDLVIWHWGDDRLQSQQERSAGTDRAFSYLCIYRVKEKKFIRLADRTVRQVNLAPKQRWAVGLDNRAYQLMSTLDGRNFQDIYVTDLHTGVRKLTLKKNRYYSGPSPDGTHFLYYDDGHFYTYEMATGESYNITKDTPASFVNTEDDHNIVKPPTQPIGWAKDGKSVLISDGWDVWNLPVHGGAGINLTVDGRKEGIRYRSRVLLDAEEKSMELRGEHKGIDLSGPVYFYIYGESTKKAGIARLDGAKPGLTRLLWDDAEFNRLALHKAKNADVFLFTRETVKDYPDYYVADKSLQNARRLTKANPQQENYRWTKGSRLINYTSPSGAKLQAALFLPADYQEHKRYPTIVYIYEKLSQNLNHYPMPAVGGGGFNLATYTSHGYAVLMPDIIYQVNDPGRSAVSCVLPALEAAIATGVVDRERVGLHGHSWGGYQTAFLITQSDAFKAAVAGAPLTNLISMYSSIYWNVGIANQPIFESSQGRFTGGYLENLEAYTRNSPVYFAKNVKTPLLLLHNDKDGAVDFNQGIEYFNTLRRLQKPVVMLQYKGENHGLAKAANQRDYALRMRHFFDHYLRDKAAPKWLQQGVPHLEMADHLAEKMEETDN